MLLAFVWRAAAIVENRTIDNRNGDSHTFAIPVYRPGNVWHGKGCTTCAISPDENKAYDGTWSAATYRPNRMSSLNISFSFEGTSLWVFFILENGQKPGITENTAVSFTIDGNPDGNFVHLPEAGKGLQYNALVYSRTGLRQGQHDFLIDTTGDQEAWVNFDYAIYT
ncbi:hypothetical protein CYLTODRAFT_347738 [Cylindrobasidium torrendii FP15055 ss-10]|uniref:Carbohydrate-binding module family 35 protein n=1 Tax=Cylindrobasidium torrendii FP15055 ss-10 TaxID=1314674 RepID=A0A0D7BLF8_9AGAR|nr:hypothetical protein CYLTODRAFT_347738 [Cylindrobasidium torrendii FP15055 ss-10]